MASESDTHSWEECPGGRDHCCPPDQADGPSCTFTGNIYEVGVHIADVSYFVPEGSELDKVAAQRATSVYLVQKVKLRLHYLGLKNALLLSRLLCLFCLFISLSLLRFYLFLERGKGRERERNSDVQRPYARETSVGCLSCAPNWGTWPEAHACAPTRN